MIVKKRGSGKARSLRLSQRRRIYRKDAKIPFFPPPLRPLRTPWHLRFLLIRGKIMKNLPQSSQRRRKERKDIRASVFSFKSLKNNQT
jgi:hypothetical protein